jgi:hypothetical protein
LRSGDDLTADVAHNNYALVLMNRGDLSEARRHLQEGLDLRGDASNPANVPVYNNLGWVLLLEGDPHGSLPYQSDSLRSARLLGFTGQMPYSALGVACCATHLDDPERAALLHGGADALLTGPR